MGDDQEWFDWEFILDAYQETKRQLDLLDNGCFSFRTEE